MCSRLTVPVVKTGRWRGSGSARVVKCKVQRRAGARRPTRQYFVDRS
jgi:hypothetical protein